MVGYGLMASRDIAVLRPILKNKPPNCLKKHLGYSGNLAEIRIYFSKTWGNNMNGIEPTEPCLYYNSKSWDNEPPKRIL